MDGLALTLKQLTTRVAGGSFATRANRQRGLQAMAAELKELGFKTKAMKATNLSPKHINKLIKHWKNTSIADVTIRNRLGWLRWWAEQINKPGLLPADNSAFGLADRTPYQGNKARRADPDTLAGVKDPTVRMALRLEAAFGLRREEALKFNPSRSIRGDRLCLVPSTTKGGRYREIRVCDDRQRALLVEVRALAGSGSITPASMEYVDMLQRYKHQTRAAGLGQAHGLRHGWAQRKYQAITGWACPAAGGPTLERLTPEQTRRDRAARMEVSREMGHGRLDVVDRYLGRRWATPGGKRAAA